MRAKPTAVLAFVLFTLATTSRAQDFGVGPRTWLPGDAAETFAAELQDMPDVAPGGPGFLAVWQDQRTLIEGNPNAPFETLLGNVRDIYAARLDTAGRLIDRRPIVVSNLGHLQATPRVAWNGQSWLVVFATHRPGNYYARDIVGVRVAPDGQVLDPQPILIEPDTEIGIYPHFDVASDGSNWAVVWEAWSPEGVRGIEGSRVTASGAVVNPGGKPIHFDSTNTYAHHVSVAFASDRYLVTWVRMGDQVNTQQDDLLVGKLVNAALDPVNLLNPAPFVIDNYPITAAQRPNVASDGTDFFVAWQDAVGFFETQVHGARVSREGAVLDPAGIRLGAPTSSVNPLQPAVAWDGTVWVVAFPQEADPAGPSEQTDLVHQRVTRAGQVVDPAPVPVAASGAWDHLPAIAPAAGGGTEVVYVQSVVSESRHGDVLAARIGTDGSASAPEPVSIDLPRQNEPRFASHDAGHLIVFLSDVSGSTRLMAQRLGPGTPGDTALDPEPVVVASAPENSIERPDVAWNGSVYLVVWHREGQGIFGRRIGASGVPVDPAPFAIFAGADWRRPAVGALGDTFLVVGTIFQRFSTVKQNWLQGRRVSGAGQVLDPLIDIRLGFELDPRVTALGGSWLVVWESQSSQNNPYSTIRAAFVSPAGTAGTPFTVPPHQNACSWSCGDDPDVAVDGDTALVVWYDNANVNDTKIDGRLVRADGTFASEEIEVAQAPGLQLAPAVTWDGLGWVVSWVDYRTTNEVAQLRGDVYVGRVDAAGNALDPGGVPVTSGPLPEEQPDLAPNPDHPGRSVLAYAALGPDRPIGYRIALHALGEEVPPPPPPAPIASLALNPASVIGGKPSTGTVVLSAPAPAGGARVLLSSADPTVAVVPSGVTVAAGATTATFSVTTRPVLAAVGIDITASYSGDAETAVLTVEPPVLSAIALTPATFAGGCQSSTGKVTLTGKAPSGGVVVPLTNTNPAASVPASVTVPAGSTSATFPITAPSVTALQTGAVSATYGGVTKSGTLKVRPVGVASLTLAPNPVGGPGAVTGTVTLECPAAPGSATVALSSSALSVARTAVASVTIPAGSTTATFTVTTSDVSAVSYATIKAVAGGVAKTVRLTVNP